MLAAEAVVAGQRQGDIAQHGQGVAVGLEQRRQQAAGLPVVTQVVTAGIKAILNFSPGALKVPDDVKLKSVDLTVSLESLSFYLAQGENGGS